MSKALKLSPALKELRIHLCQTSNSSQGVRDFIEKHYVNIKSANSSLPILVRECSQIEPRLWARFEKGKEKSCKLSNMSADDMLNKVMVELVGK